MCRRPWSSPFSPTSARGRVALSKRAAAASIREQRLSCETLVSEALTRALAQHTLGPASRCAVAPTPDALAARVPDPFARRLHALTAALGAAREAAAAEQAALDAAWTARDVVSQSSG